jgi:hypothetical protein
LFSALAGYEGMLQGQQQLGAQSALGLGQIGSSLAGPLVATNNALAGAQGSAGVYGANSGGSMLGALGGLSSFLPGLGGSGGGGGGATPGLSPGSIGSGSFSATPAALSGVQITPQMTAGASALGSVGVA